MAKAELQSSIDFAEITFAIPAQEFGITCSLSTEEALPVVTETALRLVHTCESLTIRQLQDFFGFSHRETSAVINTLLEERLVEWDEDVLRITPYARGRFIDSDDSVPRFFRIKEWSRDIVFDLMSFKPGSAQLKRLRGVYAMVELAPKDLEKESHTKVWAERSFQENFHKVYRGSRAEIYKISEVEPGERFYLPLSCRFAVDLAQGFQVSRSLSEKSFENRIEVAEAISAVLATKDRLDNSGLADFIELFDGVFMKHYLDGSRFNLTKYVADVHMFPTEQQTGSVVPILGSVHLSRNKRIIQDKLVARRAEGTDAAFWVAPQSRLWARSRSVRSFLRDIAIAMNESEDGKSEADEIPSGVKIILQCGGVTDWSSTDTYKNAFPEVYATVGQALGGRVELLVIPNRLVCALYHFQSEESPVPIPIGFVSGIEEHVKIGQSITELLADGRVPIYRLVRKNEREEVPGGIFNPTASLSEASKLAKIPSL